MNIDTSLGYHWLGICEFSEVIAMAPRNSNCNSLRTPYVPEYLLTLTIILCVRYN